MELSRIQALWSKRVTNKFEGFLEKPTSVGFLEIFGSTGRLVTLRFNRELPDVKKLYIPLSKFENFSKTLGEELKFVLYEKRYVSSMLTFVL